MRTTRLATALVVAGLALAAPAVAGHWHGGSWWGWGIGVGPLWWAGGWAVPPPWYGPGPVTLPRADVATVDLDVSPEHARVVLDGELIGVADDFDGSPGYLFLRPGHYTLEFTLKGYKSEKVELDAARGRYVPIDLKLERIPGEKPAPWYDRPEGLPTQRVFGPKVVTAAAAEKPGPNPALRPELRSRAPEAAPPPRSATGAALDLRVTPPNAAVYLDGKLVGTGEELGLLERGLAVASGRHRIEVVAPGHASKSVDVDVAEGKRQQVIVELEGGTGQT
jgi:hypothetical protein